MVIQTDGKRIGKDAITSGCCGLVTYPVRVLEVLPVGFWIVQSRLFRGCLLLFFRRSRGRGCRGTFPALLFTLLLLLLWLRSLLLFAPAATSLGLLLISLRLWLGSCFPLRHALNRKTKDWYERNTRVWNWRVIETILKSERSSAFSWFCIRAYCSFLKWCLCWLLNVDVQSHVRLSPIPAGC